MATLSTMSVTDTGINQIDSLLCGTKWGSNVVTFSFPATRNDWTGYSSGSEPYSNFIALNSMQQAAARAALESWSNVCNLSFTETTGGNGVIRFGTSSLPSTSWAYYPSWSEVGGDVWFGNSNSDSPTNPVVGGYDYDAYVHEIGHALGLKHPHDTGGVVADLSIDSVEFSVMSYRSYVGAGLNGYTIAEGSYPTGPMMSDIAAVQMMYGANFNYNSGDTVYTFTPGQTKIFQTVWDGGGNDTYDLSAYTTQVNVDLIPGEWSTFKTSQLANLGNGHYARGNVANALLYNGDTRSLIENAIGGSGNDTLTGNQADNCLNGGLGADTMKGGLGDDIYIVDNVDDIVIENANEGADTVQSSISWVLGANVENLTLTGAAAINGTGNNLDNILIGNSGANTLNGGLGADTMKGGLGGDIYLIDNTGDIVIEGANAGTDTVQSSISYVLGANVENLTLTGVAAINGTGNNLDNVIVGNSGANILNGRLGADTMQGGLGNDVYFIDNTNDIVVENANEGTDRVNSSISWVLGANVENLVLIGIAAINGTGNALNNILIGNSGANTLNGGLGADTMRGGLSDDVYVIDNPGDIVVEGVNAGTDTVQSSISCVLRGNVENLTLTGAAAINGTGNNLDNVIIGNSGANILNGGLGADTMTGGLGNDIYVVDNTNDIVIENANEGTDRVNASVSYTLGSNVENLTLTGTAAINGTGNALNNILIGNSGANILNGGLGADTMKGGLGDDVFVFDTALDFSNVDKITDFTTGQDKIELSKDIFASLINAGPLSSSNFLASANGLPVDGSEFILYNTSSGALFYDADGIGQGAAVQFATLTTKPVISAADFRIA